MRFHRSGPAEPPNSAIGRISFAHAGYQDSTSGAVPSSVKLAILGEAGLGKSALINRITRRATEAGDWVTPQLRIPDGTDPMKKLASALLDLADQALSADRCLPLRATGV